MSSRGPQIDVIVRQQPSEADRPLNGVGRAGGGGVASTGRS